LSEAVARSLDDQAAVTITRMNLDEVASTELVADGRMQSFSYITFLALAL